MIIYVSIAVLIQRTIGLLLSGGVKKINIKATLLPNYFAKKYLYLVDDAPQNQITPQSPETIWQFWDNPKGQPTPDIVKTCIKSVKKFKENFDHKILDTSTIANYTDLPGYVFDRLKKGQMHYAHFSDLLRLNLLKNHGGVWMDATLYMTGPIHGYIINENFFVFLTGKLTRFPYSFVQNCFIRAKKGSFLCDAWYRMCVEYWKKENGRIEYFQHQLMFKALILNNPAAKESFAKMPQISEDETLRLGGDNLFKKFDTDEWEDIRRASFFQKTRYKTNGRKYADAANHPDTYFSKLCGGIL
jgi:hypothetical protein